MAQRTSTPIVSVVIPTFNRADFVGDAIRSVLAQTMSEFELLVVDDGSTDGTREVVRRLESDERVSYRYKANGGDASARNCGIRHTRGRYLAFLDSDDLWEPTKLERQTEILDGDPDVAFVHCTALDTYIDRDKKVLYEKPRPVRLRRERTAHEELLYRHLFPGSNSSMMVRRDAFRTVGLFDETLSCCDTDLLRRLTLNHPFRVIPETLVRTRKHQTNITLDADKAARNLLRHLDKLSTETIPEFRHHLPRAAVRTHLGIALRYLRLGRLRDGTCSLGKAVWLARECPSSLLHFSTEYVARLCEAIPKRTRSGSLKS